jgi:hypothetical protein
MILFDLHSSASPIPLLPAGELKVDLVLID